ncbi:MAG: PEP-CTERM sorting domain-containing protein [Pirellulales bacterium]|nr:PEP-CTERM sorting domain-containing protein [Pirellulales bacterium]
MKQSILRTALLPSRVRPWTRRLVSGLAAGALCAVVASPSFGAILLNDTWADGSRTESNLPTESPVYASAAGSVTMATGSLSYAQSASSQRLHTYFAPVGSPVSLAVGDMLTAKIDFVPKGTITDVSNRNFRFGLFYDPDGQLPNDGLNDGGGSGSPWTNAEGYAVFMPIQNGATVSTAPTQIHKRTNLTNTSLLGAGAAYTAATAGGTPIAWVADNQYTLILELCKISDTQMDITASVLDSAGGVLSTQTVSDDGTTFGAAAIYSNFDMLAFRFSSASGTADVLEFRNFRIEAGAKIPEPSTIVLASLAAIGFVARRRK